MREILTQSQFPSTQFQHAFPMRDTLLMYILLPLSSDSFDLLNQSSAATYPFGNDSLYVQNLKRSVREAALSLRSCNSESSRDSHSDGGSEHYFAPLSETGFSHLDAEKKATSYRSKRLFASQMDDPLLESHASDGHARKFDEFPDMLNDLERLSDYDNVNGFLSFSGSNETSDAQRSFFDFEDAQEGFSPPLLMDSSLLTDTFEDLLAPLSETESALIDH